MPGARLAAVGPVIRGRAPVKISVFSHHHHAVPDRQQYGIDARIVPHLAIDRADCFRVGVVVSRVRHRAVLQGVVEQNYAAGADELKAGVIVPVVTRLVRVDEREVDRPRGALAKQHGPAVVDDAAKAALELGVPTYRFLRRYLERRLPVPLTLRQVDPLIRQLTLYRDLIDRKTGDPL